MMGRREEGQGQFFYSFDLDKVVPPDHLVRQIDGFLDLSWVHKELAPYYSHTGRPSIDPVLMIRMLIVGGYCCKSRKLRQPKFLVKL
jgi:transposase